MLIIKNPDNLIFDTENPDKIVENKDFKTKDLTPLHLFLSIGEWSYLSKNFKEESGTTHQILLNFGKSYYYVLKQ